MTERPQPPDIGHAQLQAMYEHVIQQTQAPPSLVLVGLLTTTSFLLQGLTDVRLPTGEVEPISLFGITIADSGEGKSPVARRVLRPIHEFFEAQEAQSTSDTRNGPSEGRIWAKTRERLIRKIADLEAMDRDDDQCDEGKLQALRQRLQEHEAQQFNSPTSGLKTFGHVTQAALRETVRQQDVRSAMITSAEGQEVTTSGLQDQLSLLNSAWSGEPVMRARGNEGADWLDFRLALYIQLQPQPARDFFFRNNSKVRDAGLAARALISAPPSVRGHRQFRRPGEATQTETDAEAVYAARARELLERNAALFRAGSGQRAVLGFCETAQRRWHELAEQIEREVGDPDGRLHEFPDHGAKLASNVARIAALLHAFEYDLEGEISATTLEQAIRIGWLFSEAFTDYFHVRSEAELDLQSVRDFLRQKRDEGYRFLPRRLITDARPAPKVSRIDVALRELENDGTTQRLEIPCLTASGRRGTPTILIDLRPDLPHDQNRMEEALRLVA